MINTDTSLYCIFGNPVRHSKSPIVHNTWFLHHQINAIYLAFKIDEISKGIAAMRNLNIKGASVTIPFKKCIMDHLDWIDEDALSIGAVNTVANQNGKLSGFNTDYKAAIAPLKPFGIKNKRVCIIGAGGAARAVAYGIYREKGDILIVNRNKERGKALALKYKADFIGMDELNKMDKIDADIIINTTSIGMHPNSDNQPFPSNLLHSKMIVMDIVYKPLKTKLLLEAQKKGCSIINGLSMFVHQGAAQFKIWTGLTPDIKILQSILSNGGN